MGIHYFTETQVKQLESNPNVKRVSMKSITYHDHFKEFFLNEYQKGKLPKHIFLESGFDIDVLGNKRIETATVRWRKQEKRLEGIRDTRKCNTGRPRTKKLTKDEIIERQKTEIEYLKQERNFLLELERLERIAIKKEKSSHKTNTKS